MMMSYLVCHGSNLRNPIQNFSVPWHTSTGVIIGPCAKVSIIINMPYAKRRRLNYRTRRSSRAGSKRFMSRFTLRRAARKYLARKKGRTRSVAMYKRRSSSAKVPYVPSFGRFLQQKLRTTLVYCTTKTLHANTGDDGKWFNLSSIYDPENSGIFGGAQGAHQPAFHDRWQNLYNKYRVTSAKFMIVFRPRRSSFFSNIQAGGAAATEWHPVAEDTDSSNQIHLPGIVGYELNKSKDLRFMAQNDKNIVREFRNNKLCRIKITSQNPNAAYKFSGFGSTRMLNDNPDAWEATTNFGSDPQHSCFLRVGVLSKDGTPMSTYEYDIKIIYNVELSSPSSGGIEQEN